MKSTRTHPNSGSAKTHLASSTALHAMSSPTTASAAPAGFLSLAGELRNQIYELMLLREEPIDTMDPGFKNDYPQGEQGLFTLGLLGVNRTVHREASSVFYGQNCFDFIHVTPDEAASFLQKIGSNNAGKIRHVVIEFPQFLYTDPGDMILEDSSLAALVHIQRHCANLTSLTTSLFSTDSMETRLDDLRNDNLATRALELADARFRSFPSIEKIIVQVYEDGPSSHIRRTMERLGWTIRTTRNEEDEEDWGRGLSDYGDYDDYDDFDYGDDDDSYAYGNDFDDDSDFWRRAAD